MMPSKSHTDEFLGTTYLEKYELSVVLGTDSFGTLYKGRQIFLDRLVAVKVLGNDPLSISAGKRFHQEAKAASALTHPGIASVLDFGVDDRDQPYLVVEFIEGMTVSDVLKASRILSPVKLPQIFLEICDALSCAHKMGVRHGNISSHNIMLIVDEDGTTHPKILDFGVAKALDEHEEAGKESAFDSSISTSSNQIQSIDDRYRGDLYAICCVLYACLAGAPLISDDSNGVSSALRYISIPNPLHGASNGQIIPEGFESIVRRLLEKNPKDQFETVDQLKDALCRVPIKSPRPTDNQKPTVLRPYLDGVSFATTDTSSGMAVSAEQNSPVRSPDQGADNADFKGQSEFKNSTDSETRQKTTLFWKTDLAEKREKAAVGSFKRLPRRLNRYGDHDHEKSARLGWFTKNNMILSGVVMTVFALLAIILALSGHLKPRTADIKPSTSLQPTEYVRPETLIAKGPSTSTDREIADFVRKYKSSTSLCVAKPCKITERGIRELTDLKSLKFLDLSNAGLDDSEVKLLADLKLRCLLLNNNENISDRSLADICHIQMLSALSLVRTGISDRGLQYLATSTSLSYLYLDDNARITSAGVRYLASTMSPLSDVSLSGCAIDDTAAEYLLKIKSLRFLKLARNSSLSDRALETLGGASSRLVVLILAFDHISDDGVRSLTRYKRLEELNVSGIKLSERSVNYLASMKHLRNLYLDQCELTPAQVKELTKSLPRTNIDFDHCSDWKLSIDAPAKK